MMTDALGASDYLRSPAGKQMEIKAKAPRHPMLGLGVGAGFRKGDTVLRARFNIALKAIRDHGTYQAIAARDFGLDPYGECRASPAALLPAPGLAPARPLP